MVFESKEISPAQKERIKQLLKLNPDRVPVYIESGDDKFENKLKKNRYLVPKDLTMGQFMYVIRKQLKLKPEEAIYIFCNNSILPTSALLSEIYSDYKDKHTDVVIMKYYKETVFG